MNKEFRRDGLRSMPGAQSYNPMPTPQNVFIPDQYFNGNKVIQDIESITLKRFENFRIHGAGLFESRLLSDLVKLQDAEEKSTNDLTNTQDLNRQQIDIIQSMTRYIQDNLELFERSDKSHSIIDGYDYPLPVINNTLTEAYFNQIINSRKAEGVTISMSEREDAHEKAISQTNDMINKISKIDINSTDHSGIVKQIREISYILETGGLPNDELTSAEKKEENSISHLMTKIRVKFNAEDYAVRHSGNLLDNTNELIEKSILPNYDHLIDTRIGEVNLYKRQGLENVPMTTEEIRDFLNKHSHDDGFRFSQDFFDKNAHAFHVEGEVDVDNLNKALAFKRNIDRFIALSVKDRDDSGFNMENYYQLRHLADFYADELHSELANIESESNADLRDAFYDIASESKQYQHDVSQDINSHSYRYHMDKTVITDDYSDQLKYSIFYDNMKDSVIDSRYLKELYDLHQSGNLDFSNISQSDLVKYGITHGNNIDSVIRNFYDNIHRVESLGSDFSTYKRGNESDFSGDSGMRRNDKLQTDINKSVDAGNSGLDSAKNMKPEDYQALDASTVYEYEFGAGGFFTDPVTTMRLFGLMFKNGFESTLAKDPNSFLGRMTKLGKFADIRPDSSLGANSVSDYLYNNVKTGPSGEPIHPDLNSALARDPSILENVKNPQIKNDILTRKNINEMKVRIDKLLEDVREISEISSKLANDEYGNDGSAARKVDETLLVRNSHALMAEVEAMHSELDYLKKNNPDFFKQYASQEFGFSETGEVDEHHKKHSLESKLNALNLEASQVLNDNKFHKAYSRGLEGDPNSDEKIKAFREKSAELQKKMAKSMKEFIDMLSKIFNRGGNENDHS